MDPEAFAHRLSQWLLCRAGALPTALAMDGKMIRDHIGLLTLAQHEDGAPQAVAVYDQKEGTERCEQTAALALLESLEALDGKMITADPLHCQRKVARAIVEKGGDYLLQIKGNQKRLLKQAQRFDALQDTLFLSSPKPVTDESKPAPSTPSPFEPLKADFPFARSLIVLRNTRCIKKNQPEHHRTALLSLQRTARAIPPATVARAHSRALGRS